MATVCKCDVSGKKMPRLQDTSRHRARYEAPADPPGFWDLDPKGFELRPDDWPELKALDAWCAHLLHDLVTVILNVCLV